MASCSGKENQKKEISVESSGCWPFRRRRRQPESTTDFFVRLPRRSSPLLTALWEQDWVRVREIVGNPKQQYMLCHQSLDTGRTALHYATWLHVNCPEDLLRDILYKTPQAVVVEDEEFLMTPLHLLCRSDWRKNPSIVKEFVTVALNVLSTGPSRVPRSRPSSSPLMQAARNDTPPATLQVLMTASQSQPWIAPVTGAEPWDDEKFNNFYRLGDLHYTRTPFQALDCRQKPKSISDLDQLPINQMRQLALDYFHIDHTDLEEAFGFWTASSMSSALTDSPESDYWAKLLIFWRDHSPTVDDLWYAVAVTKNSSDDIVRLVASILDPPRRIIMINGKRSPLHAAVARYMAALAVFSLNNKEDRDDLLCSCIVVSALADVLPQALTVPDPITGLPPALQVASFDVEGKGTEVLNTISLNLVYKLLRPAPSVGVPAL